MAGMAVEETPRCGITPLQQIIASGTGALLTSLFGKVRVWWRGEWKRLVFARIYLTHLLILVLRSDAP